MRAFPGRVLPAISEKCLNFDGFHESREFRLWICLKAMALSLTALGGLLLCDDPTTARYSNVLVEFSRARSMTVFSVLKFAIKAV
jgi:hypothetical protein